MDDALEARAELVAITFGDRWLVGGRQTRLSPMAQSFVAAGALFGLDAIASRSAPIKVLCAESGSQTAS